MPSLLHSHVSSVRQSILAASVLSLLALAPSVKAQTSILWSSSAGSAWQTGTNWTGNAVPGPLDIAQFGANPTAATGVGINFNAATNAGTQVNGSRIEAAGAIEITSARAAAFLVGDNSTTVGATGILQLNGATVNSVANTIIRNNSGQLFTIQNTQGGGNQTMSLALGNTTNNVIAIDGAGGVTISSIITGSGPLTRQGTGAGALTLSGANTFSGGLTVSTRNVVLGNAAALGTGTLTLGLNSNLDAGTGYTGGTSGNRNTAAAINTVALTGAVTVANNIALPTDTVLNTRSFYVKGGTGNSTNFSGQISGGSTNLSLFLNNDVGDNTAVIRFSGNSNFVTSSATGANSGINLNRGSLRIDSNAALGNAANSLFLDSYSGQQLTFSTGFTYTHATTLEAGVQTIFVNNTAGTQLDLTSAIGGGDATSSLRLTSNTGGDTTTTYRLAGTNTLAGKIELYRGAVVITNNASLGNAALQLNGNNNTSLGDVRFENDVTLANNFELVNTSNSDPINTNGKTATLNGVISSTGTFALVKIGAGTLVLGGTNTYTVGTTISAGTVSVGTTANLGAAASGVLLDGGTLQITGTTLTSLSGLGHTVTYTSGKTVGLDVNNAANTFTVDQVLSQGTGGFTKAGAGTAILNQANTYTGPTAVSGGRLLVNIGGSISGSATTVSSGGTLGGSGGTVGAVTVNTGGTLAPGSSIGTLNSSAVTLNSGSTFSLEINSSTGGTDLLADNGSLSLAATNDTTLTITDLAPGTASGAFTFITYAGAWNGGLFNYGGNAIADGGALTVGANSYVLSYTYNGNSVALISVPEPNALAALAGGVALLVACTRLRRRVLPAVRR